MGFSFKNILFEQKKSDEIANLLKSGNYYGVNRNNRFYRGVSDSNLKTFKKFKIRKDRKPRDTNPFVNKIQEGIRKKYHYEKPNRSKSLFVSGQENIARGYGDLYYIFIPTNANSWWSYYDSYTDFFKVSQQKLDLKLRSFNKDHNLIELKTEFENTKISPFFNFAYYYKNESIQNLVGVAVNNYKLFLNHSSIDYSNFQSDLINLEEIRAMTNHIGVAISQIQDYFSNLNEYEGYINNDEVYELIVEGDHYISANKNWFDSTVEPKL